MRVVFLPLAVPLEPAEGPLSRGVPREIAARVGMDPGIEAVFRPFLHEVEGKRRFGVYDRRWPAEDLKRFLAEGPEVDLLVHGDADFSDPIRVTLEVLSVPDLEPVDEETFEAPRFDGFSVIEKACRFLRTAAGGKVDETLGDFPTRKFETFLHLLRGRDAAARLDDLYDVEDPEEPFEPFFLAVDEEPSATAPKDELALLAATAASGGRLPIDACERAARRLLDADRRSVAGWAALGRVREMAGDPAEAETALRKAVDLEPGRATLRFELGSFLLRRNRLSRAAKILETVKADPQVGGDALLDLGTIRAAKDDPEGAIDYWRQAVERDPGLGLAWANLGKLLVAEGRFDEAEEAFDRGFALPHPPGSLSLAAGAYLAEQNRTKDAIEHLEVGLRERGTDPLAHYHLGRCYEVEGDKARALHHLRRAMMAGGEAAAKARETVSEFTSVEREEELMRMLADAIARPPEEQIVLLKSLLKEEVHFPAALVRLGIALLASKKPRSAEKQFRKAIKMVPEDPEAWGGLATALKSRKKLVAALEAHEKAIELSPNQAGFHLNLADTLARLGRTEEADAAYRKARALDPTNPLLKSE